LIFAYKRKVRSVGSTTLAWRSVRITTQRARAPCNTQLLPSQISTNMDPINAAIAAIDALRLGEHFTYTEIAERYGVVRSTLTRRHQGASLARELAD
ncbi:hypothetical protein K458DRAFT_449256, partial [Lentithecium fluviatile CBS 122367]